MERTFTQELIPFDGTNKTISFTAFCIDGEIKTYWMGIKLREHPLEFGTATLTESVYVEECFFQSEILLKKLHYEGVCEVEFLKDPRDNKFKLIENKILVHGFGLDKQFVVVLIIRYIFTIS